MRQVLLVTGGSRGIGAATARLAARRGYHVAINYVRDPAAADAVLADVHAAGADGIAVPADVGREDEVLRLFAEVDRALGPVTVLVNNAGVVAPQGRVDAITETRLQRVLATNVVGSFLCAREAVRRMSTRTGGHGGSIVNVSSRAAQIGGAGEYVDYAASKAAVDALTVGLAKEVAAEGIRVNAVRPGIIATDIHASGGDPGRAERLGNAAPLARPGTADEVARAILWLASDEASYCTATIMDVGGGR